MLLEDFAQRTRTRITEARGILTRLREVGGEATRQLAKIDKLPEAARPDVARAQMIQEELNDLASELEEISLASSAVEDLGRMLKEAVDETYTALKGAETQLTKVVRTASKLGI